METPANSRDPQLWLEMADQKLAHARQIFAIGLYGDAISRAYYAMYYAAKAALLREGLNPRKDSSVIAGFGDQYVTRNSFRNQRRYKYRLHLRGRRSFCRAIP